MKLDYISSLFPYIACLERICGPRYFGPKSAIFSIFVGFSNITVEIVIKEENIRQTN